MATVVRRVPVRGGVGGQEIQFKNVVRKAALDVREVTETSASTLYNLCRAKANQVMMMKHRGYVIPPEEQVWLESSLDEAVLIQKSRSYLGMKISDIIGSVMNRVGPNAYKLEKKKITNQTTYNFYPYLERESSETLELGEFFYRDGRWELSRKENELTTIVKYTTEVRYVDNLSPLDYSLDSFSPVAGKIVVYVGEEKDFKKELEKMVIYRRQGVEIFHLSELLIDYFQHWLVPSQEILGDTEKLRLLAPHLMIRVEGRENEFKKIPNCQISEGNLPTVHHTDIVIRYIGALPGQIIYWTNESYISSFSTREFGYMMVVGHKYSKTRVEENLYPGEQHPPGADEDEEEEELEEEELEDNEDLEEGDDYGGGGVGEEED